MENFTFCGVVRTIAKARYDETIIHKRKVSEGVIKNFNYFLQHILE